MSREAPLAQRLLELLSADAAPERRFLSGAQLAAQLQLTRSAVWKAISSLREMGLEIEALPRMGYRLARPLTLLRRERIDAALQPHVAQRLQQGACHWSTDSTNAVLLARGLPPPGRFEYVTAEYQTAGRGRRGRSWFALPGAAICLTWSWCFDVLPPQSGALSLAIGVSALRALAACGIAGVRLKWPNDLVADGRKLGGILIELKSESGGPALVVVGIGINVAASAHISDAVEASGNSATDLGSLTATAGRAGPPVDRSRLVAALLDAGVDSVLQFSREGLAPFLAEYRAADALYGRDVLVSGVQESVYGRAAGIDADGALLVGTAQGQRRFVSGEVSVRQTAGSA